VPKYLRKVLAPMTKRGVRYEYTAVRKPRLTLEARVGKARAHELWIGKQNARVWPTSAPLSRAKMRQLNLTKANRALAKERELDKAARAESRRKDRELDKLLGGKGPLRPTTASGRINRAWSKAWDRGEIR